MEIFAKRLRERAVQLGISNAEAARRVGLDERRYAHYVSGRRQPDLMTLKNISEGLGVTPNWLLDFATATDQDRRMTALIDRFVNSAKAMTHEQLELAVIQAEAVVVSNR
ncbi:XRE family transcriptional regulator [Mesorhizobium waimense]|uniref:XRE family transcriptional regulator n=1 Tax=Mesorhizobium waimense TaxID=1300307 RepID=A0A3A5K278_9HYPH|nr:helix-turn-helix transcriptional regulator [Mesorhizobium waimense]RJT29440.1 XRE family transcriptional regulator [Mesorhizobium waimense]